MSLIVLPVGHQYSDGRECSSCLEFKPAGHYSLERDARAFGGVAMRSTCKPCTESRKYKADIKRRYGISYEEYEDILEQQNNCCAICKSDTSQNNRATRGLFVDHCHTTGKVRGLLCSKCNHALGLLNDDIDLLKAAMDYLTPRTTNV